LLAEAGYRFEIVTAEVEEVTPAHLTVRETVLLECAAERGGGGGTAAGGVRGGGGYAGALDGVALGKPGSMEAAREMLGP